MIYLSSCAAAAASGTAARIGRAIVRATASALAASEEAHQEDGDDTQQEQNSNDLEEGAREDAQNGIDDEEPGGTLDIIIGNQIEGDIFLVVIAVGGCTQNIALGDGSFDFFVDLGGAGDIVGIKVDREQGSEAVFGNQDDGIDILTQSGSFLS